MILAKVTKLTRPAGAIDWNEVRERMDIAMRRTEEVLAPPSSRTDRILRERARAMAKPPAQPDDSERTLHVIPFGIAGEPHLIESRFVFEVLRGAAIAPLPRTPEFLLGVTNIRGELIPVFDLALLLGSPATPLLPSSALAILGQEKGELAMIVDWVEPVTALSRASVLVEQAAMADRNLIQGITTEGRPLLDGEALLADPRLFLTS